jgi:hypothetical protein
MALLDDFLERSEYLALWKSAANDRQEAKKKFPETLSK